MKKYISFGIIFLIVVLSIGIDARITNFNISKINASYEYDEYTHDVLVEFVATSKCGYCPTANSQLDAVYNLGEYDFFYITLVADENYGIYDRIKELGVSGVPDVFFDGGYRNVRGAQEDEQAYINALEASGVRSVPDISLDVKVEWKAQAVLTITVTVLNNEDEEFNGFLRVYIVEPESRWKDVKGDIIGFGVLDIPIEKPLSVAKSFSKSLGETYTFKRTWFGSLFGFGDISADNIMVVASLFDKSTDYAVQTVRDIPEENIDHTEKASFGYMLYYRIMQYFIDLSV
jgi:glutaredoxin